MEKTLVDQSGLVSAESDIDIDTISPSQEDIATLAYALWEERGGGDGGADEDWFEAERQLRAPKIKAQAA